MTMEGMEQAAANEAGQENLDAAALNENGTQEQITPEVQPLQDEQILQALKEKGFEVNSFDDLRKAPEKIIETKEVNPYEGILDDDDRAYLQFKIETGRGRKDYESLHVDYDKVDPLELARERVRKEAGINLNNEEIDEYIISKLGIEDLGNLTVTEKIELAGYAKPIKDEKKAEQEKYRKPAENKPALQQPQNDEYLKLDNGQVVHKQQYEAMVQSQQRFIEEAKAAGNSVTASAFSVTIDDNGTPKTLAYKYEFGEQDRHSMVSDATNLNAVIDGYKSEQGFDHAQFQEGLFWMKKQNREKAISDMAQKIRAEAIEETMKLVGNHNFTPDGQITRQIDGVKVLPVGEVFRRN